MERDNNPVVSRHRLLLIIDTESDTSQGRLRDVPRLAYFLTATIPNWFSGTSRIRKTGQSSPTVNKRKAGRKRGNPTIYGIPQRRRNYVNHLTYHDEADRLCVISLCPEDHSGSMSTSRWSQKDHIPSL